MKTVGVLAACLALAAANMIEIERIPSKLEQYMRDGSWNEKYSRHDETEGLGDYYNTFYVSPFSIGTPFQNFTVQLDTGSSDLWVAGPNCFACVNMKKFDPSKSSTYKKVPGTFSIQYGSGALKGDKAQDVVKFPMTDYGFPTQTFGLATQLNPQQFQHLDGICGMAYQSISSIHTPDPWKNIITSGNPKPPNPWFTFWLEELKGQPQKVKGGAVTFGDFDKQHCSTSCSWVPLSKELWYEMKIDSIGAGSYTSSPSAGISDTGTSFLIGPPAEIRGIAQALGGNFEFGTGLYAIGCTPAANAKTIDVKLNGKVYSIHAKNYIVDLGNTPGKQCYLAMQGADIGNPPWILGDTFIREWCNSYDMQNNRIGLCQATM